jgi:hypothetical protein
MPQATSITTRNPFGVAALFLTAGVVFPDGPNATPVAPRNQTPSLDAACHAATVSQQAMTTLSVSVANLPPDDPRHIAAYAAAALLRPRWQEQVALACHIPALSPNALQAKATLLASMIERDGDDAVVGPPALQLAAALANDLLAYEAWDAGG